jgi:hypothetical protein
MDGFFIAKKRAAFAPLSEGIIIGWLLMQESHLSIDI